MVCKGGISPYKIGLEPIHVNLLSFITGLKWAFSIPQIGGVLRAIISGLVLHGNWTDPRILFLGGYKYHQKYCQRGVSGQKGMWRRLYGNQNKKS